MDFMLLLWFAGPDEKEGTSMKWRKNGSPVCRRQYSCARYPDSPSARWNPMCRCTMGEIALYRAVREAVPIVDAALMKIIRLVGGFVVRCPERTVQEELAHFLRTVPVGRAQRGWIIFWSSI